MSFWTWSNYSWVRDIIPSLKNKNAIVTGLWKTDEKWEHTYKWDRSEALISNQNVVLMSILENASTYNKWKAKPLRKFIKDFISKLSITESNELLAKLYYYLEVYEMQDKWWSKKLDDKIIVDVNWYNMWEIMYELLITNVYLPEYENQKKFNTDMISFISRLEKRITKFRLWQKPVVFPPINHRSLLNYMDDNNGSVIKWVKHLDKWIVKKIWYRFALDERDSIDGENEFYFEFLVDSTFNISNDKKKQKLLSRDEYIRHLTKDLSKRDLLDGKNFYYTEDSLFRYTVYVWENFFKASDEIDSEWFSNEVQDFWFEVRVMANPKNDLDSEEIFANVCRRLPWLTEQILEDIYESYWRWPDWNTWYPSKPEIFDLSRIINAEEKKDWYIKDFNEWSNKTSLEEWNSWNNYKFYAPDEIEYTLNDLILEDKMLEPLYDLLDYFKNIEFYKENNWILPGWMVLSWPPGTWKTTIMLVLWKESWAWIFVPKANQENSLVWESANNIDNIISKAEEYIDETWNPAIIFFDEADTLFSARWWDVKDFKEWMLSVLLQKMDWFDKKYQWKLTFAFGTNRDDILDKALLSRIDKHLVIDLPSFENRIKIIDLHIANQMKWIKIQMYELADIDLDLIAEKTKWKSGRFIKKLIWNAHFRWLRMYGKDKNFTITTELILSFMEFTEKKEKKEGGNVMWFDVTK